MEAQSEDDSNIDIAEVRKFLEDANVIEPNMTEELMLSYYTALKNSENTASEEDQTRRLNQSQEEVKNLLDENDIKNVNSTLTEDKEKPFIPKSWNSEKRISLDSALEHNNNENLNEKENNDNILEELINDSPKDATKTAFGFNEMVKDSEFTLNVITHKIKFVPIQSSNKFLNAGTALKARMLYAYHTKVNKMKSELARLSYYPAPLPKTTNTTMSLSTFSDTDLPETYVCRSGRQTKRKIYNYDDEDSMDGTNQKKIKNSEEQEWLNKPVQTKNPIRSHKKQESNKQNNELNKTEFELIDTNKEKKSCPKKEIRTPLSKKISNAEIMKRSNLFGEPPKRRCEAMFEKLREDEEKKEKEEKRIELFNKTLDGLDEENVDATPIEDIITVDDEESVKIRVVPPVPRRKINSRKRNESEGLAPLDIKINAPSQDKSTTTVEISSMENGLSQDKDDFVSKTYPKKRSAVRKMPKLDPSEALPSTSRISKATSSNTVTCPICNGAFNENKIEEHASTCGDESVASASPKMSRITCEICDKVVDFNTNYEVHVKNCIARKKEKD